MSSLPGHALALDQAGAYLEEVGCSLEDYRNLYKIHRADIMERRGGLKSDQGNLSNHPHSVTTTWSLSFKKVESKNRVAADLLRLCSFLQPDAIPKELIIEGAVFLGRPLSRVATNPLAFNEALASLRAYSLVQYDENNDALSIHPLVQVALQSNMTKQTSRLWIKRIIRALEAVFPEVKDETWPQCERILTQAQHISVLISQHKIILEEAAHLLERLGFYLQQRERYEDALPLYQQALSIQERLPRPVHPNAASCMNNLATIYRYLGQIEKALPLYQQALSIREQLLGPIHPDTAIILNNLAALYFLKREFEEALPLSLRVQTIWERNLGPQHPYTLRARENYASLLSVMSREGKEEARGES